MATPIHLLLTPHQGRTPDITEHCFRSPGHSNFILVKYLSESSVCYCWPTGIPYILWILMHSYDPSVFMYCYSTMMIYLVCVFFKKKLFLFYVYECFPACMSVHHICAVAVEARKILWNRSVRQLRCHVGAKHWAQVLYKSNKCSQPLRKLS